MAVNLLKSERAKQPEEELWPHEEPKRHSRVDQYEQSVSHCGASVAHFGPCNCRNMKQGGNSEERADGPKGKYSTMRRQLHHDDCVL